MTWEMDKNHEFFHTQRYRKEQHIFMQGKKIFPRDGKKLNNRNEATKSSTENLN